MVSPQTPFQSHISHTSQSLNSTHNPNSIRAASTSTSTPTLPHPPAPALSLSTSTHSHSQPQNAQHAPPAPAPTSATAAPDSPRSSQSPVPEGFQGNLELELLGLANALYNLGTTVINDSTKERERGGMGGMGGAGAGGGSGPGGGINMNMGISGGGVGGGVGGGGMGVGGKQVGLRVNQVIQHLNIIDSLAHSEFSLSHAEFPSYSDPEQGYQGIPGFPGFPETRIMIPFQILTDIDNARNPMALTRERLERAATENQFMNGKIEAVRSYREYLNEALCLNFPDLEEYLRPAGA
ncbi:hypothetical protein EV360DRAFT_83368 [Lentinula raphanica]|nr:hypothetical protein EV360DRAFT_83368 [Lentinula raphanica]